MKGELLIINENFLLLKYYELLRNSSKITFCVSETNGNNIYIIDEFSESKDKIINLVTEGQ